MPRRDFTFDATTAATTDAGYRAAGRAFSDALVGAGLTRVGTPINWDTIARPTASGSGNSYAVVTANTETFEFTGTLASTYPVRLDINYAIMADKWWPVAQVRALNASVAGSSNGSWLSLAPTGTVAAGSASDSKSFVASDGQNWLNIVLGENLMLAAYAPTSTYGILSVERLRDANGAYNARGVYVATGGAAFTRSIFLTNQTGSVAPYHTVPALMAEAATLLNGQVALWPHNSFLPGQPPTVLLYGAPNEWSNYEEVTIEGRTYRAQQAGTHALARLQNTTSVTQASSIARHLVRVA